MKADGPGTSGHADITVIGAGIVGMSCALYLQRSGLRVAVISTDPPGAAASYGNAGVLATANQAPIGTPAVWRGIPKMLLDPSSPLAIRWSYVTRAMPWFVRFLRASRPAEVERISIALSSILGRTHDAYAPLLQAAGAEDLIRRQGWLHLFETPEAFASAQFDIGIRRARGVAMEVLEGKAIRDFEPGLQRDFHRAVFYLDPAHTLDPLALVRRFVEKFLADGGTFEQSAVRRIDFAGGELTITRANGTTFRTPKLVIAAGAWSKPLAAMVGSRVPLDTERGYHVMLPKPRVELRHPLVHYDRKFAITPMKDGLRLAGTIEFAGLNAPPNPVRPRTMIEQIRKIFPHIETEGATDWLGFRPSMPDSLPVIGHAGVGRSVFLAFGHGHLGLTLGPVTGRIIADLVSGRPPEIDISPFAPDRFR